ncbi:MAG: hypothetical protein AB7P37_22815 [Ramlibacter sp.]
MQISFFLLPVMLIIFLVWWATRKSQAENDELSGRLEMINAISMDEARKQALGYLQNSSLFSVQTNVSETDGLSENLPQTVIDLAKHYSAIQLLAPPFVDLNFRKIENSKSRIDFSCIGIGMESSDVRYELCVVKDEEFVYEIFPSGEIDEKFGRYASIYHLIVALAQEASSPQSPSKKAL